jgi:hypothetical protein
VFYKSGLRRRQPEKKYELPSPEDVSLKERIFDIDGVMRWHGGVIMGYCALGVPLKDVLDSILPFARHPQTGSYSSIRSAAKGKPITDQDGETANIEALLNVFEREGYILSYSVDKSQSRKLQQPRFLIVLKEGSDTVTQVASWFHAFLCVRKLHETPKLLERPVLEILKETLEEVRNCWPEVLEALEEAGWDVETGALETRSGVRMSVESGLGR